MGLTYTDRWWRPWCRFAWIAGSGLDCIAHRARLERLVEPLSTRCAPHIIRAGLVAHASHHDTRPAESASALRRAKVIIRCQILDYGTKLR